MEKLNRIEDLIKCLTTAVEELKKLQGEYTKLKPFVGYEDELKVSINATGSGLGYASLMSKNAAVAFQVNAEVNAQINALASKLAALMTNTIDILEPACFD